jgi:phospholipid transport system substrate-binding protein
VAPHFALQEMSRIVVGRNAWNAATPDQRMQFAQQFKKLLIRTYSSALASYQDETVKFMPIRGGISGNRVQVNSVILRQGAPSIAVSYRLIQLGQDWKVYDLSVDGISLVESYRTQFAAQISQGGNLSTLTQKLMQHNG